MGDVTGHGVAAAADMALIRGMVTALLHSGVPVADVFSGVSGVLRQRPGVLLATAALAVIDLAVETVTFATAGHPPPVLRLPDGQIRMLDTANAPIIGHVCTRSVADVAWFPMGSLLVMFTDGLVERRDRPFDVGVGQVAAVLAGISKHVTPDEPHRPAAPRPPAGPWQRGRHRHPRRRTRRWRTARLARERQDRVGSGVVVEDLGRPRRPIARLCRPPCSSRRLCAARLTRSTMSHPARLAEHEGAIGHGRSTSGMTSC